MILFNNDTLLIGLVPVTLSLCGSTSFSFSSSSTTSCGFVPKISFGFYSILRFQNSRFHVSMLLIELAQCARTDSGVQVLRKFYRSGKTNIRRSGFEGN